jgi:hypothetical protein
MVKVLQFDKQGKRLLPAVKVGNERLNQQGQSKLAKGFVACEEHGTVPYCWVRNKGLLTLCCRFCILKYCQRTTAVFRSKSLTDADANPIGHSF